MRETLHRESKEQRGNQFFQSILKKDYICIYVVITSGSVHECWNHIEIFVTNDSKSEGNARMERRMGKVMWLTIGREKRIRERKRCVRERGSWLIKGRVKFMRGYRA